MPTLFDSSWASPGRPSNSQGNGQGNGQGNLQSGNGNPQNGAGNVQGNNFQNGKQNDREKTDMAENENGCGREMNSEIQNSEALAIEAAKTEKERADALKSRELKIREIQSEIELNKSRLLNMDLRTQQGFEAVQRLGNIIAACEFMPVGVRGNKAGGFLVADMILKMKGNIDLMQICQNLYVINGKFVWSASFLIGQFNDCKQFTRLRYKFEGKEGQDNWGCRAWTTELATGEELWGTRVTIRMAKLEGWMGRKGSKWLTMAEQMLQYRAAVFFIRLYAPEIMHGLREEYEAIDIEANEEAKRRQRNGKAEVIDVEAVEPEDVKDSGAESSNGKDGVDGKKEIYDSDQQLPPGW